jgi:hypothetical protein
LIRREVASTAKKEPKTMAKEIKTITVPKPKARIPVPPPAKPHTDKRKELERKICRKKIEKP